MLSDGYYPFSDWLLLFGFYKFWIEECRIFIFQFHLISSIVCRNGMCPIVIFRFSVDICPHIDKILVRLFISCTVYWILKNVLNCQNRKCGSFFDSMLLVQNDSSRIQRACFQNCAEQFLNQCTFFRYRHKETDSTFILSAASAYTLLGEPGWCGSTHETPVLGQLH